MSVSLYLVCCAVFIVVINKHSDTFSITNGVKQASTIFSIFLSAMLEEAFRDMGAGYTSNLARMLTSLQLHTSERRQNYKYTCERTAFCRRQRTNYPLSRGDPEDC